MFNTIVLAFFIAIVSFHFGHVLGKNQEKVNGFLGLFKRGMFGDSIILQASVTCMMLLLVGNFLTESNYEFKEHEHQADESSSSYQPRTDSDFKGYIVTAENGNTVTVENQNGESKKVILTYRDEKDSPSDLIGLHVELFDSIEKEGYLITEYAVFE